MEILDIHTHRLQPDGVTSLSAVDLSRQYGSAAEVELVAGHLYSVGIHPWDTEAAVTDEAIAMLEGMAVRDEVVAIGECGADTLRGGAMFRQLNIFRRQAELAERVGKPLIVHDVKAHEAVLTIYKEVRREVAWAVHGFRYRPSVARMFTDKGIYLSFGAQFNPETVARMPRELILAETDDDVEIDINRVIDSLSAAVGSDMREQIAANTARFLRR